MQEENSLIKIRMPDALVDYINNIAVDALKYAGKQVFEKFGESVPLPYFFHIFLCRVMQEMVLAAPSLEETERMILQAFDEVRDRIYP